MESLKSVITSVLVEVLKALVPEGVTPEEQIAELVSTSLERLTTRKRLPSSPSQTSDNLGSDSENEVSEWQQTKPRKKSHKKIKPKSVFSS